MDKVILAYSGGLDTSCAIKWIKDNYGLEVICFSAFIGEVPDKKLLRRRARLAGASKVYIEDLRPEFAQDFILPALLAEAKYEGKYPMATSLGRPLIVKHLVKIAHREGARYVAHGCSGKGNDQVRIEVGVRTLDPSLKIIAPLKEWEFKSREEEIDYAKTHKIPVSVTKKSPYSIDKNIWGIAIEAGLLEDPNVEPSEDAYYMTQAIGKTPKAAQYVTITWDKGVPKKLNGKAYDLVSLIERLNTLGGRHGVGRIDMVENRLVGIKSREIYEAPAAVILLESLRALGELVYDREFFHYKRLLSEKYAELVYYGLWFTPLREALDAFFGRHKGKLTGNVRVKLHRGHAIVVGRTSPRSLYSEKLATYSAKDTFSREAANGFVKLWGLPYEKPHTRELQN
ncbi:MAG: argininosuccinate synthase [Candidatus Omnitrophica bacterium]|nr:argininosuccinate synthase [Candidatus Omnitrophota bacterium]